MGAVIVAGAVVAGCGGDDDDEGGRATTEVPDGGGGDGTELVVEALDSLDFGEDEYTAPAGDITFVYEGGRTQHSLVVEGHEDDMRLVISGDRDEGSLTLDAGEYLLYCDIPGHQAGGMVADLVVG